MQINKVIKMTQIADVYEFVNEAGKVDGDVLLKRGNYIIDGKSVMGVFSLNLSQPVTISYPADAAEFDSYVKSFEV